MHPAELDRFAEAAYEAARDNGRRLRGGKATATYGHHCPIAFWELGPVAVDHWRKVAEAVLLLAKDQPPSHHDYTPTCECGCRLPQVPKP